MRISSPYLIHHSYDIDALDPEWAPSTGHAVPGGLTLQDGTYIARRLRETDNLVVMDLVEVNPSIEPLGIDRTVQSGCSLIRCVLGGTDTQP